MLRIYEVKIDKEFVYDKAKHLDAIAAFLGVKKENIVSYKTSRRSIDARKKPKIFYNFNFDVMLKENVKINPSGKVAELNKEQEENKKVISSEKHAVIVGFGPSGIFGALTLLEAGVKVTILERGKRIDERQKDVDMLLKNGVLNPESNIQFGEGGAGTFSDGKLNTGIGSPLVKKVLAEFYKAGAGEDILYDAKPHIGTDKLREVIVFLRERLISLGAKIHFESKFTRFEYINGRYKVYFEKSGKEDCVLADDVIFAVGYSARDTIRYLNAQGVMFKQKPFSVGYRIEHLQKDINFAQYGVYEDKFLPPADYKLFCHLPNGRTVYTFCMCPGGVVVPASSEHGGLTTNGMSYHAREGKNANSAVLVSVDERDYNNPNDPLAGMTYQEKLEKRAFEMGGGKFLYSTFEAFKNEEECKILGNVKPTISVNGKLGNCFKLLDKELALSIKYGIEEFGRKLKGFDSPEAVLTGIETRSSAPFMAGRDTNNMTNLANIYMVGEGAGRAGGIVSSAVDGIIIARSIINKYE